MELGVGDVDPFPVGNPPPVDHPADHVPVLNAHNLHIDKAVVDEDVGPSLYILVQLRIGDGSHGGIPGHILGGQGKGLVFHQLDGPSGKAAQADFRALGVHHGGDRQLHLPAYLLEAVHPRLLLRVGAVGKVEARHVHPRQNQGAEGFLVVGGRPQGAYNLCLSHVG